MGLPDKAQQLKLTDPRNIDQLTMRIYRVKVNGDTDLNPENEKDYKKLKPLMTELPELQVTRLYTDIKAYELFKDTLEVPGLPVGVYLIEMESEPTSMVSRRLYFVSNVRTMVEMLPDNKQRYVVVSAIDGQPQKGATIELKGYVGGRSDQLITLKTDDKGEVVYQYERYRPSRVYAYTSTDKACPRMNVYNNFYYYDGEPPHGAGAAVHRPCHLSSRTDGACGRHPLRCG